MCVFPQRDDIFHDNIDSKMLKRLDVIKKKVGNASAQ